MGNNNWISLLSCENLDRVANWVGTNMASAFVASLERCSCITLNTADFDYDSSDELMDHRPALPPIPTPADDPIQLPANEHHQTAPDYVKPCSLLLKNSLNLALLLLKWQTPHAQEFFLSCCLLSGKKSVEQP